LEHYREKEVILCRSWGKGFLTKEKRSQRNRVSFPPAGWRRRITRLYVEAGRKDFGDYIEKEGRSYGKAKKGWRDWHGNRRSSMRKEQQGEIGKKKRKVSLASRPWEERKGERLPLY